MGKKENYSLLSRNLYGMAEFYGGGAFVIINTFFTAFLIKALGMPAALAGTIPLVGKIWDAVTDPIMGNITDRTVSRFGPKRFYILVGGIISALTFVVMWITIPTRSTGAMYAFYLFMYCLFSTGFTIISVPYNGLLPDMIDDYTTRAKFSNVRMIWSTIGSAVCGLVPTFIITDNTNPVLYLYCALLFGVLFFITSMVTFAGTWEHPKPPVKASLIESFPQAVSVFKSRSFRLFIGIYLFGQCGMDIVSGMATFARKISAGMSNALIGILLSAVGYDSYLANNKIRQSLETQRGIVYIFVFVPVILMALLIIVGYIFPLTGKEFAVVKAEIARRKGESDSPVSDEEKQICEKVTGISYENLWNPANTFTRGKNK